MRASETNLQKERSITAVGSDPTGRHIANIDVAMQAFLVELPDGPLQLFSPLWIGPMAIIGTGRAIERQETTPIIVVAPVKKRAVVGVLNNDPFVEPSSARMGPRCILPILTHQ